MESAKVRSAGVGVQRIRRARWAAWLGLAAALALTVAVPGLLQVTFYGVLFAGLALYNLYAAPQKPPPDRQTAPMEVEVERDVLVLRRGGRGADRIARPSLIEGWIDSFRGDHRVVLRQRGGDLVWIRIADREEGQALLRGLGFGVEQHVYTARLVSIASEKLTHRARAAFGLAGFLFMLPMIALVAAVSVAPPPVVPISITPWAALFAVLLYFLAKVLLPRTGKVGVDGVTVTGFRSRKFHPFAGVSRVWADERGVWMQRASGLPTLLATMARMNALPSVGNAPLSADTMILLERVKEAVAANDATGASAARFSALDRNGRPVEEWQRSLRALLEREASGYGYRQTYLDRDELARLVESAGAAPERRIAAAIALSSVKDDALQIRLRFATNACASEELRAALEQAAEGEIDEARLERATQRTAP